MATQYETRREGPSGMVVYSMYEYEHEPATILEAHFTVTDDPAKADYWAAGDGKLLLLIGNGGTCINNAESLMRGMGWKNVYAIWAYKNPSPAQWARWSKKWAKKTAEPRSIF